MLCRMLFEDHKKDIFVRFSEWMRLCLANWKTSCMSLCLHIFFILWIMRWKDGLIWSGGPWEMWFVILSQHHIGWCNRGQAVMCFLVMTPARYPGAFHYDRGLLTLCSICVLASLWMSGSHLVSIHQHQWSYRTKQCMLDLKWTKFYKGKWYMCVMCIWVRGGRHMLRVFKACITKYGVVLMFCDSQLFLVW